MLLSCSSSWPEEVVPMETAGSDSGSFQLSVLSALDGRRKLMKVRQVGEVAYQQLVDRYLDYTFDTDYF